MTTQTTFSRADAVDDYTKTQSRDISLDSVSRDLDDSIIDFNNRIEDLLNTLNLINNALTACQRQVVVIEWCAKQLVVFMKELCDLYVIVQSTQHATQTITYPWLEIYRRLYDNCYKNLIDEVSFL